ncbi:MAG: hypothetical protein V2A74_05000 [bacterium]
MRILDYRLEAEALSLEQELVSWRNWIYGDNPQFAQTYEGHERLFSRATLDTVKKAIENEPNPREKKSLRYFHNHLLLQQVGKEVAPLEDEKLQKETAAEIRVDNEWFPYRMAQVMLAQEEDYERRATIYRAITPILTESLNPLLFEKETTSRQICRDLGFDSYNTVAETYRNANLDSLGKLAESFLATTQELYLRWLGEIVGELMGFPLEKFRVCDISRLLKSPQFDAFFPKEKLVSTLREVLEGLGIDLREQTNLRIHDAPLEKKNPRAVCFPLKVPEDIRLSVKPVGGHLDYESLFHEMGHGQHFANTRTTVWEFQHLGDNTITETYAFLMEGMLDHAALLEKRFNVPDDARRSYLRFKAFAKLFMVRRYCAKLLYETAFHAGQVEGKELYGKLLARAYGFAVGDESAERYLNDMDDFFYSADYLRAWLLEAQLETALENNFGHEWFANPKAGDFLRELWAYGTELGCDELIEWLGFVALTPDALLMQIANRVGDT